MKKYKLIHLNVVENLLSFLDECLETALMNGADDGENRELIHFCEWGIKELINAKDGILSEGVKDKDLQQKMDKRWNKIDEKFFDWKLPPDMNDKEFEKMLNQFDAFLRGWEKEYNKKHPEKPAPKRQEFKPPHIEDVAEYMSLEEVKKYLLEDSDLSDEEAFDLYYDERERRKPKKKGLTYDQLLKKAGIYNPKD
jgi:hypothetical protein